MDYDRIAEALHVLAEEGAKCYHEPEAFSTAQKAGKAI